MLLETFVGNDLRLVFEEARRSLGDDVLVLRSSVSREGRRTHVELIAASQEAITTLRRRLDPKPPSLPQSQGGRGRSGPLLIALVGPTGGGKTTVAAKLALHRGVFSGKRTGLLTLDTFRVGAVEQIQQYAEIASVPVEVAYDVRDVQGALKRLDGCDVVIIDTPGRSPRATEANTQWQATLRAIAPDEVQLVVPATMRPDAMPALLSAMAPCRPTHACVTKFDELHDDRAIADVAARIDLPIRWITDGQSVPGDLHAARSRVLSALGVPVQVARGAAA